MHCISSNLYQVAGASACLITILYFTYLLRWQHYLVMILKTNHCPTQGLHSRRSPVDGATATRTRPRDLRRPLHPRFLAPGLGVHRRQPRLWWLSTYFFLYFSHCYLHHSSHSLTREGLKKWTFKMAFALKGGRGEGSHVPFRYFETIFLKTI